MTAEIFDPKFLDMLRVMSGLRRSLAEAESNLREANVRVERAIREIDAFNGGEK